MGVGTFRTSFTDVSARLTSDPSAVRLEGRAAVESISIANPPQFRDHVVNGADFFDAGNHPEIVFSSSRIDLREDGSEVDRRAEPRTLGSAAGGAIANQIAFWARSAR